MITMEDMEAIMDVVMIIIIIKAVA